MLYKCFVFAGMLVQCWPHCVDINPLPANHDYVIVFNPFLVADFIFTKSLILGWVFKHQDVKLFGLKWAKIEIR